MKWKGYIEKLRYHIEDVHSLPLPPFLIKVIIVIQTLFRDMINCDLLKQASVMAYVTIGSLVPSLVAFFSLISVFTPVLGHDSKLINELQNFVISNLAQGTGDQVALILRNFLTNLDIAQIGITMFAGFLVTLIFLLKRIEVTFNRVWLVRTERSMFARFIYFWTFITLGAFIASLAVGFASDFSLSSFVPFMDEANIIQEKSWIAKKIMSVATGYAFLVCLYIIVPNCKVKFKEASIGAIFSSIMFVTAAGVFSLYAEVFSKHKIYGALAALPLFLTWLYYIWVIVLLGSVISWRIQQGFPFEKNKESEEQDKTPFQKLRNLRLRSLFPFFVLMGVYKKFLQSEGTGLKGTELKKLFNVSPEWIVESLELLENLGYIAPVGDSNRDVLGDYMSRQFFPRFSPTTLKVEKIKLELLPNIIENKDQWSEDLDSEYVNIMANLLNCHSQETTLFDVIK